MTKKRANEIDIIRGFCIVLMIWHHLMYDVRYLFRYDSFSFFESFTFQNIIHPFLLIGLFMMSGISQSFSKNHIKRFIKMTLIAVAITLISSLISYVLQIEFYILWQIIHSLAFCIGITILIGKGIKSWKNQMLFSLILAALLLFIFPYFIEKYDLAIKGSIWLLPFGIGCYNPEIPLMADYIPVIPLGGFFFIGVFLGNILYPKGHIAKERFNSTVWQPLRFLGKYSLWVYAVHQPILIFLIWLYGRIFL